ncbi:hypothetical protein pdam_00009716 [Pocillopora damicornis]|uniref:Uncharacterized protein n=1 Tax=Pocillopora damicornis TaxID=46731 RepID=A0A3M6TP31_POCDA|nr:hypothetical protein pdam_00009716 [Pocillopora damicornis]
MSCKEKYGELCEYCRATDFLHQLYDPIPLTENFLTITTYQVRKHLRVAAKLMIINLVLKIKQMVQGGKPKARDKKAIKEFSKKYIVSEKLVADYSEHLTDIIEMRKDKRPTDNDRNRAEESDRDTLTLTGKISITEASCHPLELVNLSLILITRILHLKERKIRKKVRTTFSQLLTQIQSDSDNERAERIVGYRSNSSELNELGDQATDSQQRQEAEKTIPESNTTRYGRKRTRILGKNCFIDRGPSYYTRRVKEAIHIRLHPNNINRDSEIEIPEAWMLTIKKHNNRRAEHCEKEELYPEYRKMSCQKKNSELCEYCRATDFVSPSPATPTPRPYPDCSKLPDYHYHPSTKTPTSGRKPDHYQPRA